MKVKIKTKDLKFYTKTVCTHAGDWKVEYEPMPEYIELEAEPVDSKPDWEIQIDEWFKPSLAMNIDFNRTCAGNTTELVYRENGKEIKVKDMLKDYIRKLLKEFADDFEKQFLPPNRYYPDTKEYSNNKMIIEDAKKTVLNKYVGEI